MTLVYVAIILALAVFALDRHLILKEVERDLKECLGDLEVLRDASSADLRVHFSAQVAATKSLIRNHFKL
jgi:hypothetical protein